MSLSYPEPFIVTRLSGQASCHSPVESMSLRWMDVPKLINAMVTSVAGYHAGNQRNAAYG